MPKQMRLRRLTLTSSKGLLDPPGLRPSRPYLPTGGTGGGLGGSGSGGGPGLGEVGLGRDGLSGMGVFLLNRSYCSHLP